jgi:hypothetical protein
MDTTNVKAMSLSFAILARERVRRQGAGGHPIGGRPNELMLPQDRNYSVGG